MTISDSQMLTLAWVARRVMGIREGRENCFRVSYPLTFMLLDDGVNASLVEGVVKCGDGRANHFWVDLGDGRVLDPTANQFNDVTDADLPTVYLGPPTPEIHGRPLREYGKESFTLPLADELTAI